MAATNPYGGGSWKTVNAEQALHDQYEQERSTLNDQYMANGLGMFPDSWTGMDAYLKSKGIASGRPDDYYKSLGATSWDPEHPLAFQDPNGQWNINQFDIPQGNWVMDGVKVPAIFAAMIASAGAASGAIGGAAGGLTSAAGTGLEAAEAAAAGGWGAGLTSGAGTGLEAAEAGLGDASWGVNPQGGGVADTTFDSWDWGNNGGPSLEPDGGWGDTQSIGQQYGSGTYGTQSGGSLIDQIKSIYDKVPPGTQQLIKSLMSSGDQNGLMSLLGKLGAAGLGAFASNRQSGALSDLAAKYAAFGAPSRARFEASMQPGFDPMSIPGYAGAVDTASKGLLARLSATGGNPFGNPAGLVQANKDIISGTALPAISDYQRTNLAGGGVANMSAAVPSLDTAAIGKTGDVYSSLGYGLNAATNPNPSLADQLRALQLQGLS